MPSITMTKELQARLDMLNSEQRQAVEAIDGPVLVVAGPGTGKTELLSLRVAMILLQRDILPQNILCLTFTEAGAEAMQQRLADLIGPAAYLVQISTFHAFTQYLASGYPEYFARRASDVALSPLAGKKLMNSELGSLPVTDPLYQRPFNGKLGSLGSFSSFVSAFKYSGLTHAELTAIIGQNEAACRYIEDDDALMGLFNSRMPPRAAGKAAFFDQLAAELARLEATAPKHLTERLIAVPGVYEPWLSYFVRLFSETELYDSEANRSEGYQKLRGKLFQKDGDGALQLTASRQNAMMASALGAFQRYQAKLEAEGRYDFDDMISDAIKAIEASLEFKHRLQDRYQYLLVDEFQDTNGSQMRILDLLADSSKSPNLLVVGDDDQAIMRFQGASVRHLLQFEQRFSGIHRVILKTNYRSTPSLVGFSQRLSDQIEDRLPASASHKRLVSAKSEAAALAFTARRYASREIQYYDIASRIREQIDTGFIERSPQPDQAIAVIASRHQGLEAMIPHLNDLQIPFKYKITSSVGELQPLQTLFSAMRAVAALADGAEAAAEACLPAVLSSPELGISAECYIGFALDRRSGRDSWLAALKGSPDPAFRAIYGWLAESAHVAKSAPVRSLVLRLAEPLQRHYQQSGDPLALIEFNLGLSRLIDVSEQEMANARADSAWAQPLCLADVIAVLDDAQRFDQKIAIDLALSPPGAISLTTAHGSKGLEYDHVYLIDADDSQWHGSGQKRAIVPDNMLFGQEKDDDDSRRLLFVAASRARVGLDISFASANLTRELTGLVSVEEAEPPLDALVAQSAVSLSRRFYPPNTTWPDLVRPRLANLKMSASLLNSFMALMPAADGEEGFFSSGILRLPEEPSVALEFGDLMHRFFEDWLNHVVVQQDIAPSDLLARYSQEIDWLDFEPAERGQLRQRLELIYSEFMPLAAGLFKPGAIAERWGSAQLDDVPLTGKFDLLVCDTESKGITVYDFKTSKSDGKQKLDAAQWRQLKFYKLLLELGADFAGWTVTGAVDLFVDPTRVEGGRLAIPKPIDMSAVDLDGLKLLIKAVWRRIQEGDFDMSGFQSSSLLAELLAASVFKSGARKGQPKPLSQDDIQAAFEQWLVAEG